MKYQFPTRALRLVTFAMIGLNLGYLFAEHVKLVHIFTAVCTGAFICLLLQDPKG